MIADNIPANTDAARDFRLEFSPRLPRQLWAMAVRYSLHLLEKKAPGAGVEVRVAPWGAIKILDGPASDPHNLHTAGRDRTGTGRVDETRHGHHQLG